MKTAADQQVGGDAGQQGWIQQRTICGVATEEMWDDGNFEMGWKDGKGLGKYCQGKTTNLRVYRCSDKLCVGATMDLQGN